MTELERVIHLYEDATKCPCDTYAEIILTALRTQQERENPKPLTLDELREMDGEPVYLVDMEPVEYGWEDGWYLVDADEDEVFNGIRKYELKRCVRFAYRYKPKEAQP